LDSLLSLGKFAQNSIINLSSNSSQTNSPYIYNVPCNNAELNDAQQMLPSFNQDSKSRYVKNECKQNDFIVNVGHSSQDSSMPFLSLSLK